MSKRRNPPLESKSSKRGSRGADSLERRSEQRLEIQAAHSGTGCPKCGNPEAPPVTLQCEECGWYPGCK